MTGKRSSNFFSFWVSSRNQGLDQHVLSIGFLCGGQNFKFFAHFHEIGLESARF